jgi:hypothetical protein
MLPTPPIASPHIQRIAECQATVFTAAVERVRDALRTADVSLPMPDTVVRTELRTAQLARQLGMSNADRVAEAFRAAAMAKPEAAPRPTAPRGGKTRLQLLDDDALDADLAMSKLVRKTVDEIDPETLAALDMRIGELQGSAPADRESNPLGPRAVMLALFEATTQATEEVEVRLALMSLLQPHVAAALRGAYDAVNESLIAAGVLPDTTLRVKKDAPTTPRNGPEVGMSQAMSLAELLPAIHGLPTTLELQRMLRGLVGRRSEPTPLAARILADARNAYHGAAVESPVDPETLAALMAVQQLRGIDAADLDDLLHDDEPHLEADPLATLRAATANDMAALDQLTGQLVAVVLEFVLHDPAVPEPVKRQIARLQIVAFRAALLDRTFFARRDHPFRQLLDRIAALALEPEHAATGSAFQNTLVRITDALVSDFRDDLSIFAEKLAELDATLDFADGTQAEAVAQAIQALPEQEALHGVRQRALAAIEPRLHAGTPPAIVAFLRNEWIDVLVATWRMRGGEAKWQEQMALATRLLWSLQPHPRERLAELSKALPAIVGGIRRGLEDASIAAEKRNAILEHLFEAHQHIVRQARQPGAAEPVAVDASEIAAIEGSLQPPATPARTPLRTGFELTLMRDGEETRARIVAVGGDRLLCVLAYADGTVSTERCDDLERRIDAGDVVLLSSPHGIVERALALMAEPDAHRVHGAPTRTPAA